MNEKPKELKEHSAQIFEFGCMERPVYLKEDVDAVIAGLKQKLQDQCISCPVKMQEDDVVAEKDNEIRRLIENEFSHAVTKHPKFCDHFIDESARTWAEAETKIKARNSRPPEYADCVLMEEMAEAFSAYSQGNMEHALQEFAQCGAVVMRCMFYVMEKIDKKEKG